MNDHSSAVARHSIPRSYSFRFSLYAKHTRRMCGDVACTLFSSFILLIKVLLICSSSKTESVGRDVCEYDCTLYVCAKCLNVSTKSAYCARLLLVRKQQTHALRARNNETKLKHKPIQLIRMNKQTMRWGFKFCIPAIRQFYLFSCAQNVASIKFT